MKTKMVQKKQCYVTPEVTVVTFKTEHGFNNSLKVQTSTSQMEFDQWDAFVNQQDHTDVRSSGADLF